MRDRDPARLPPRRRQRTPALAVLLLLLAGPLAGCLVAPDPGPAERFAPTGVTLTEAPATATFGGTLFVKWTVRHHADRDVTTDVRFGPTSRADGDLAPTAYPYAAAPLTNRSAPGAFQVLVPVNLSTLYYRAHAEVDGVHYWSPEVRVQVVGAPFGAPLVHLAAPGNATAGAPVDLTWHVENASGGVTSLAWGDQAERLPVGAVNGTFHRTVTFPHPGAWPVEASLLLSGSVVARANATVHVAEPATPHVTFIAPPETVQPEEEVTLRWRVHGPGDADAAEVTVNGVTVVGAIHDGRNFTATLLAPLTGNLTAVARATVDNATVESAPLDVPVVSTAGPHAIRLVAFPSEAPVNGAARVTFNVQGPNANSTHLLVHTGNASVRLPADHLSPTHYGGVTLRPDGYGAGGPYPLPGSFTVTVPLPEEPGLFYLRAHLVVGTASYWSEEAEVLVVRG